jgi:hypothetical protein
MSICRESLDGATVGETSLFLHVKVVSKKVSNPLWPWDERLVCLKHWHHLAVVLTIQRILQCAARWCLIVFKMAKCVNGLCHLLYSNFHVLLPKINQLFTCKLIVMILTT